MAVGIVPPKDKEELEDGMLAVNHPVIPPDMRPLPPDHPPSPPEIRPLPPTQAPSPVPDMIDVTDLIDDEIDNDDLNECRDLQPKPDDRPPPPNQPPKKLNIGQRIAQGTVSFLETTSALVWGTAIMVDEEIPLVPVPGDYAVTSIAAIGARDALQSLRVLARREHPLDYLFLEGGGSFAVGLGKELGKKAVAAIPPVLFAIAASYGRDRLFNYAMSDPEQNQLLVMTLFYLDTPLMRSIVIGVPAVLLYLAGQKIIERYVPGMQPPELEPIDNPHTNFGQKILEDGLNVINSVTFSGFCRQVFNSMGPAIFLHSPYSLLMAPIAALFVLPLLHYVGEELHPLQSVKDFFAKIEKEVPPTVLDDANAPVEKKEEGPSKARIAVNIATKVGIALGVFALAALVNRYASDAISRRHDDGSGEFQNDPSGWTSAERIGYEAALTAGVIFAQRILENLPALVQQVKLHGPEVIENIKIGTPMVMKNIKDGVGEAALKSGQSIKHAVKALHEFCKPSFQGMFSVRNEPQRGAVHPVVALPSARTLPPINVEELDFDFPCDDDVTGGGPAI